MTIRSTLSAAAMLGLAAGCNLSQNLGEEDVVAALDGTVADASADGATATDAGPTDAAPVDAGPRYSLHATFVGFPSQHASYFHVYCHATSSAQVEVTSIGNWTDGEPGSGGVNVSPFLVAGETYEFDYWFDNSNFNAGYNPTYRAHSFGPVTGDTTITLSPDEPILMH